MTTTNKKNENDTEENVRAAQGPAPVDVAADSNLELAKAATKRAAAENISTTVARDQRGFVER